MHDEGAVGLVEHPASKDRQPTAAANRTNRPDLSPRVGNDLDLSRQRGRCTLAVLFERGVEPIDSPSCSVHGLEDNELPCDRQAPAATAVEEQSRRSGGLRRPRSRRWIRAGRERRAVGRRELEKPVPFRRKRRRSDGDRDLIGGTGGAAGYSRGPIAIRERDQVCPPCPT